MLHGFAKLIVGGPIDGRVVLKAPEWRWTLTPDEAIWLADQLHIYAAKAKAETGYQPSPDSEPRG